MRRCLLLLALGACAPASPEARSTTPQHPPQEPGSSTHGQNPRVLGSDHFRMPGPIQLVAFHDDAVVAVSQDGTVRFFDRESGEPTRELRAGGEVWEAAMAIGTLVLRQTDRLALVDPSSGATEQSAEPPGRLLAATEDGRRFFGDDRTLVVERRGSRRSIPLSGFVSAVDAGRDGRFVAVGVSGAALLFEPGATEPAHGLAAGGNGAVAIDPRNRWVVVEDPAARSKVGVWSLANGQRVRELDKPSPTGSMLRFSPDGRFLAMVVMEELVVWRTEDWRRVFQRDGVAHVRSMAFSEDGRELALGGNANTVRVFTTAGEERLAAFGHRGNVEALTWGEDGTLYSGGRFDGRVIAWAPSGEGRLVAEVGAMVESVVEAESGLWAVTTRALHPIAVRGRRTPIELPGIGRAGAACEGGICVVTHDGLHRWSGVLQEVTELKDTFDPPFSPNGDRVLTRYGRGMVLRRTGDGEPVARFEVGPCLGPSASALSADHVAIFERARTDDEDAAAGRVVLRPIEGEGERAIVLAEPVTALAFVGEGVAMTSAAGVHFWQPGHVPALRTLALGPAHSLAPNGEILAVGMTDGRIRLVDVEELQRAPATSATPRELPTACPGAGGGGMALTGSGLLGTLRGGEREGPDPRYFGMFADPHHRP